MAVGRNRPVLVIADKGICGHYGGMPPVRRVVIVTYPDIQPLDLTGPAEVFGVTNDLVQARSDDLAQWPSDALIQSSGSPGLVSEVEGTWTTGHDQGPLPYEVDVVAEKIEPLTTRTGGYSILPGQRLADLSGPIDTLIVSGGVGAFEAEKSEVLVDWIREAARNSRRVASVCTGAILLAAAGLLDGHRVTSHWAVCPEIARRYPDIEVDSDPIFIRDRGVWTSAGVTAGMDLALAMVAEDLGEQVALEVARWMVLFLRRPGGQAQFSSHVSSPAVRPGLRGLQLWMADHLDADLRVEALADRALMSPRNFARAFRKETGMTPASYVEMLRVERARQLLEGPAQPIEQIALQCGFGTPETMRRAFSRRLGVSPAGYRERFRSDLVEA